MSASSRLMLSTAIVVGSAWVIVKVSGASGRVSVVMRLTPRGQGSGWLHTAGPTIIGRYGLRAASSRTRRAHSLNESPACFAAFNQRAHCSFEARRSLPGCRLGPPMTET